MPPKKGNQRKKPVLIKLPEFSDDDLEIPEIEEEEVEHRGEKHPEDSGQPDGSDKKKWDSKKGKGDRSEDSKASSSTSKTTIHSQELADTGIKLQFPLWCDPKFGIPILGVVQIITIITGVYLCVSLQNGMENLKSCQKGDTAVDNPQSCTNCMCVATEGFSFKEFSDIMQNQRKTEEKYMQLENSVEDLRGKLSENDDRFFGFNNKIRDFEKEMSKLHAKIMQFNSNFIIGMEDFIAMFDQEWGKREEKLMKDFDSRERTLKGDLDKEVKEIEENIDKKHYQFQSTIYQQWQGNIQSIGEQLATFKNGTAQDLERIEEKMKVFDNKFEGVHGQMNFFFQEIYGLNNYILAVLLVVVFGVIIVAYKSLISRQALYDRSGHPVETSKKPDSGQKAIESTNSIIANLKRKGLKNGTLIISFHPSTQQFHQNVLNAVSASIKSEPSKVVIQGTDDLMNVDPQKRVIIFVDFNDRNIILENEETEIGDLRNQTTKVFMSLGCDVFVVYCKDKGSKDLKQDVLYNATLTSIDRHPVLSVLRNKNRVLSIHDKFHPHQVEHLKSTFQQP